jgi:O-antigen ligase
MHQQPSMKMPNIATPNIATPASASLRPGARPRRISRGVLAGFAALVLTGSLAALYPLVVLGILITMALLGICWLAYAYMRRIGLELWQVLTLTAMSGYLLLNYGFENLTIHAGGFPIIIGYAMVYGALGIVVLYHRDVIAQGLREPVVVCVLALIGLAFLHLLVDVPSFGLWALRDATMCLDGMFIFLGLAWAMRGNDIVFMTKWLMVYFILNMFYIYTFPWAEKIWGWSPESGVFLQVPLLGNFNGTGDMLLAGALFCVCVAAPMFKRWSWIMPFLAVGQLLGVAIAQVRRMYLGIVIVTIILIFLGEIKKFAKFLILVPAAVMVLILATTVGGLEISGRIGPVNLDFFKDHIRSIHTSEGTPGSSVESRFSMVDEAMEHFYAHPAFGVGFGEPLLSELDMNMAQGAVGRVPHDSSITYLARMGIIGFVMWILLHICLWQRFVAAYRMKSSSDPYVYSFVLWIFLFYILTMITSFVEAPFEFPSGAVPFYFFMGYCLGLIRWHLSKKNKTDGSLVPLAGARVPAGV